MTIEATNIARTAAARERRQEALAMRCRGMTEAAIGKHFGVSQQRANRIIQSALDDLSHPEVTRYRALENERLDAQYRRALEVADDPDPEVAIKGVAQLTRISERRARLNGLDVATKAEVSGPGGGPIPISMAPSGDSAGLRTFVARHLEFFEGFVQELRAEKDAAEDGAAMLTTGEEVTT